MTSSSGNALVSLRDAAISDALTDETILLHKVFPFRHPLLNLLLSLVNGMLDRLRSVCGLFGDISDESSEVCEVAQTTQDVLELARRH